VNLQTLAKTSSPVENIIGLDSISWECFNKIESAFEDIPRNLRLTYLDQYDAVLAFQAAITT